MVISIEYDGDSLPICPLECTVRPGKEKVISRKFLRKFINFSIVNSSQKDKNENKDKNQENKTC